MVKVTIKDFPEVDQYNKLQYPQRFLFSNSHYCKKKSEGM